MLLAIIATVLATTPGAPEVLTRPFIPPTFTIGIGGTSLTLVEHREGSLSMMASDGGGSVSCAAYSPNTWREYRNYFANMIAWWPTAPHLRFASADPQLSAHSDEPGACDISAFTTNYRLYVEVARLERGKRTGLVRVELSPIQTTHTVVDASAVQRVDDNTFGALLLETAIALSGRGYNPSEAAVRLSREIEDTTAYNVQVIEAHSDVSLFVLVLDAFLAGGSLPNNNDIEAAYRLRKVLRLTDSESFFTILAHIARDEPATAVLEQIQTCGEAVTVATCLSRFSPVQGH